MQHLYEQGIDSCILDNESEDNTVEIAQQYKEKGVFRIESVPYKGYFDFIEVLKIKEKLIEEIDADWFIHYDADEIREAPGSFENLKEAFYSVEKQN